MNRPALPGSLPMHPVGFVGQTTVFAEDQPEYNRLPAYREKSPHGRVVTCWKMNWRERVKAFVTGVVWCEVLSFNQPLQPQRLTVNKPDLT